MRLLGYGLLAIAGLAALYYVGVAGLSVRRWTWEATTDNRFVGDMQRNVRYGTLALQGGYLNVYEDAYASRPPGDYDIDYPPLRLLTFELWMRAAAADGQDISDWQPSYRFNRPILEFNTFTEAMSAIAAVLLVQCWTRPSVSDMRKWESWGRAAFAGLLVWFSPAALADGHGWASYDVWIPPFFLWALYLCSVRWWVAAGIVLGIGAMFKGQMLLVAPLFVLWPALAGDPLATLRFACGFVIAAASVAAPFILSIESDVAGVRQWHDAAIAWIGCVAIASILPTVLKNIQWRPAKRQNWTIVRASVYCSAALLMIWPAFRSGFRDEWFLVVIGTALLLLISSFIRRWNWILLMFSSAAVAMFASMRLFDNNPAWWLVGFKYGTERFFHLIQGQNANLPALLNSRYGWSSLSDIFTTIRPHLLWNWPHEAIDVDIRQLLVTIYLVGLLICSIAAAVHWRRRDRRFLVAASAVWILFYALLPQMIGRYLLFGATAAAIATAESVGLGLLSLFLSCVAALCTLQLMSHAYWWNGVAEDTPLLQRVVTYAQHVTPGIAWGVLMVAVVFVGIALNFRRRGVRNAN